MSTITELINFNFGGIRRKDSRFTAEKVTCSDCQNVELYYTELNSGVGIRTANGNTAVTKYKNDENIIVSLIPSGENVINFFETVQNGNTYFLVYTESATEGKIYNFNMQGNTLTALVTGLTPTGKACGTDFTQGWLDMFVFSNGVEVKYIYSDTETGSSLQVETDSNITLEDQDGRDVSGLGIVNFDSRLWIFNGKVLWYSQQAECRNFAYNDPDITTSSGYIEFVKPITAIYPYLGSLAVFHKDSSVLIKLDGTTGFKQDEESPGGCASYNSLVFHGTDLYFYDDTKKGVFSFKQIVNGDKTLGDNIAFDIQDELIQIDSSKLDTIRSLSVVTSDRNEVWFLIPISDDENYSYVMIYDYIRDEWVKRKCQKINAVGIVNSKLYSAGKDIYEEYFGSDFDGEYIQHYYQCTIFNFGADNTLKITKFPPRLTIDAGYETSFWVKYVRNYDLLKTPKIKELKTKTTKNVMRYDIDTYDTQYIYVPNKVNTILKMPSVTFKALEITIYTETPKQSFCIKAMEFSKIKIKQV